MNAFWAGFEKRALQETRSMEDLSVGASTLIPLGTTLHVALKDKAGKDSGTEWLARMGGTIAGSALGGVIGGKIYKGKRFGGLNEVLTFYTGKTLGQTAGAMAGAAGGEILASRLVHSGKYDEKGRLKAEYGGKQNTPKPPAQG